MKTRSPVIARNRNGMTIIELLVVFAILAILAVIAIPAFLRISRDSSSAKTVSDLKQIGVALNLYAGENNNFYPIAGTVVPYGAIEPRTQMPSWQEQIDGYVEGNRKIFAGPVPKRLSNGEYRTAYFLGSHAAYAVAIQAEDPEPFQAVHRLRIASPSKYILAGEIVLNLFPPEDADCDNYSQDPAFGGKLHTKTPAHLLFADGHVGKFRGYDPALMMTTYSDQVP